MPYAADVVPRAEVELVGDGWTSGPVRPAQSFAQRWRGLRPRPGGVGLWIAGRSVHGFGMREALLVVALDRAGTVIAVRRLAPRGLVVVPGAASLVEVPVDRGAPRTGSRLRVGGGTAGGGS